MRDPRHCTRRMKSGELCKGKLVPRGAYFSQTSGYHRYKFCSKCGRTYTTHEQILKPFESPTPTPA